MEVVINLQDDTQAVFLARSASGQAPNGLIGGKSRFLRGRGNPSQWPAVAAATAYNGDMAWLIMQRTFYFRMCLIAVDIRPFDVLGLACLDGPNDRSFPSYGFCTEYSAVQLYHR